MDDDDDTLPEREYFWNVFNTFQPTIVKQIVRNAHQRRMNGGNDPAEEQIEIREDLLNAIMDAPFYSSKNDLSEICRKERKSSWTSQAKHKSSYEKEENP